jgi:GTP pyrophosphokinase
MVTLNYRLATGEQVEILTARNGTPSRDWINASLGYVRTQKARSRIQRWFKEEDFEHNVAAGRSALERELDRLGARDTAFDKLAVAHGIRKIDDFLAAIGSGDLRLSQAVSSLRPQGPPRDSMPLATASVSARRQDNAGRGMSVQGVGNLMTQFAACCNPLPGDNIVGYITQGRGITVHRRDCANILRLEPSRRERIIPIEWGRDMDETFAVDIQIRAFDRKGLLHDVSRVFHDANINVLSTASESNAKDHHAFMRIRAEVASVEQLSRLLSQIGQVPNVLDARRVGADPS